MPTTTATGCSMHILLSSKTFSKTIFRLNSPRYVTSFSDTIVRRLNMRILVGLNMSCETECNR